MLRWAAVLLFTLTLCFSVGSVLQAEDSNHAPTINAMQVSVPHVYPGQRIVIQANATDPDADPISFAWTSSAVTIVNNEGPSVSALAPAYGAGSVCVRVYDGRGGEASQCIELPISTTLELPRGTVVTLELLAPINSNSVESGSRFPLRVHSDIVVDGFTLVQAGAYGYAVVEKVHTAEFGGKPGSLFLTLAGVQLIDGAVIPLHGYKESEGKRRNFGPYLDAGALIAGFLIPKPVAAIGRAALGFFISGTDAMLPKGTLLQGTVIENHLFNLVPTGVLRALNAAAQPVQATACFGFTGESYADRTVKLHSNGVKVLRIEPDCSARLPLLRTGDRIVGARVGNEEIAIATWDDIQALEQRVAPGDKVVFVVHNLLRKLDVEVVVGERFQVQ